MSHITHRKESGDNDNKRRVIPLPQQTSCDTTVTTNIRYLLLFGVAHICMGQATHINESCHTYERVMEYYCVKENKKKQMTPSARLAKSKSLQHTATHCNTLQHTATHCNTLQHTATHCNTLQHTTIHYNPLQHTASRYSPLQRTATHCNTL